MALRKVIKTVKDINILATEYNDLSEQIKILEEKKKEIAEILKNQAKETGVKDDKGSFYIEIDDFIVGNVARKSYKLNQEKAVEILREKGLKDVIDVRTIVEVNENKLNKAVTSGKISLEEVSDFTDEKVVYSVLVKKKEDMPEISQEKFAARRK